MQLGRRENSRFDNTVEVSRDSASLGRVSERRSPSDWIRFYSTSFNWGAFGSTWLSRHDSIPLAWCQQTLQFYQLPVWLRYRHILPASVKLELFNRGRNFILLNTTVNQLATARKSFSEGRSRYFLEIQCRRNFDAKWNVTYERGSLARCYTPLNLSF